MNQSLPHVQSIRSIPFEPPVAGKQPQRSQTTVEGLTFSRHLNERLERRQLELSPDKVTRLSNAVERASSKGSRDSVVLLDDLALLVNVPSRTVLTAVATTRLKDGVFTNIDSVVLG